MTDFHNFMEKKFPFSEEGKIKKGVSCVGKQPSNSDQAESIWVLNPYVQMNQRGYLISSMQSPYVWQPIGGPHIELSAGRNTSVSIKLQSEITLPLQSSSPLNNFLGLMTKTLKHNFVAGEIC